MPKRKKVLTTVFSEKRAKARRHTGPARPAPYVEAGTGFAKRNRQNFCELERGPQPTSGARRSRVRRDRVRQGFGVQLWTPGQISRSALATELQSTSGAYAMQPILRATLAA